MFYTIYKISNLLDGKIYIGSHKTKKLDDKYMGSGKYLKSAQKKYGMDNFKKEILFVFDNPEEMYAKEAELVNGEFLVTENTYNLKVGGFGGFDFVNQNRSITHLTEAVRRQQLESLQKATIRHIELLQDPAYYAAYGQKLSVALKNRYKVHAHNWVGKNHSDETKRKMSEASKITSAGERNSQYGTSWIHSVEQKISKKISKEDQLPYGWVEGRKMKF